MRLRVVSEKQVIADEGVLGLGFADLDRAYGGWWSVGEYTGAFHLTCRHRHFGLERYGGGNPGAISVSSLDTSSHLFADSCPVIFSANSFLDQANDNLFKPRGLFCLVMSYRPDTVPLGDVAMQPVDTSNAALKWLNPPTSSFQMHKGNFRASSGISRGEIELAETAPLVYEDTGYVEIGRMESGEGKGDEGGEGREGKGSSAFKRHRKVAAAYFDKRAQAKYVSYIRTFHSFISSAHLHNLRAHSHSLFLASFRPTNTPTPPSRPIPRPNSRPNTAIRPIRPLLLAMLDARRRS